MAQLTKVLAAHLPRYTIHERIGSGGMATVFHATDTTLQRDVAIKVLHEHLVHESQFSERFEQEARFIAGFNQRNIVQVYDFDSIQVDETHLYFMVMPYIPGETLGTLLDECRETEKMLPHERVLSITRDIAAALDYAHERDMVHRDVKPANILFDENGNAILTDFGIARLAQSSNLTQDGSIIGTPIYMSPEQAVGDEVDYRSDIYALGVIVYEMLTGCPPFDSDSAMSIVVAHAQEQPAPLSEVAPHLNANINACVLTALAKDPDARYASAKEFADALQSAFSTESTTQRLQPATLRLQASRDEHQATNNTKDTSPLQTLTTTLLEPARQNPMGLVALVVALAALLIVARMSQVPPANTSMPPVATSVTDNSDTTDSMTDNTTDSMTDTTSSMTDDDDFYFTSTFTADDETAQYWAQTNTGDITRAISDDSYRFEVDMRRTAATALLDTTYTYDNASILMEVTITDESADGTSAAGIVFRYQDGQNYNVFAVDGMGQYSIWKLEAGTWTELRGADEVWTADDAINPLGEANTLSLNIYNDRITGRVNGEVVTLIEESTFGRGGVGIYSASTGRGRTVTQVDTYSVQEASPPSMTEDLDAQP